MVGQKIHNWLSLLLHLNAQNVLHCSSTETKFQIQVLKSTSAKKFLNMNYMVI